MDILETQIANQIDNTISICINDSAIVQLSDQSVFGNGYFIQWYDVVIKIEQEIYDKVISNMTDDRDFITSPFSFQENYFLTKLGFDVKKLRENI